jgi:hypothetical protein
MASKKACDNQATDQKSSDAGGKVNIAAGDINQTFNTIHPRALTAVEEAAHTCKLESKLLARGIFYERNEAKRGSFE